ncbi:MAG: isocitrate/isopropylmalate dehydrogenase family protein [Clostridiales bacterium]|nr:isocitrate/isopropylmalate dehydrogenase family protein [Candidatus Crickella merdequi]
MKDYPQEIIKDIEAAKEAFEAMLIEQYERNKRIAERSEIVSGDADCITIGLAPGDGIGPIIMDETRAVLKTLLADAIGSGKIALKDIEGFTIENRLDKGETVPAEVLAEMESCNVLLKGPTTTPNAAMGGKNLESANVFLRKHFDLYANVRPVCLPAEGIDWTFFRENTEGEYALGSKGIRVGDSFSMDFKVTTAEGSKRIAKAAFDFARANGKDRVSIVTKANIMKKTDGDFQGICLDVAKEYPEIKADTWFVDIMAANLVNTDIRSGFQVFVLPNLYGDIITDEAAQIQGGVGTAGSANIGSDYAIFEAIHGSAPRMVEEGIADRANPASLMTAAVMLLRHIGYSAEADKLEAAVAAADAKLGARMTGLADGGTCAEFAAEVVNNL